MAASSSRAVPDRELATGLREASIFFLLGALSCELPRAREQAAAPPETVKVATSTSLQDAIRAAPSGAKLVLSAGDFSGNVVIDKPLTIEGAGIFRTRWLPGAGMAPLVTVRSQGVRLSGLVLERGEVGVRVESGVVALEGVSLLRQERIGLELLSGEVRFVGGEVIETGGELQGRGMLARGGKVVIEQALFRLAGHRALELTGTLARVSDLDIGGSRQTGIQALDGTQLTLLRGRVAGVRGTALFAAAARVHVEGTILVGNEYGVLAARGAIVDVEGAQITDHRVAGYALVNSSGSVKNSHLARGGTEGGISVIGASGPVVFEDLRIDDPGPAGLHLTLAKVVLRRCTITGARLDTTQDFGDGVYAVESELLIEDSTLAGNAGSGVTLAQSALRGVNNDLRGNVRGGVVAHLGSEAMLSGNRLVDNGVGLLVAERSRAQLDGTAFQGTRRLDIDACEQGSVTENLPAGWREGGVGCGLAP